MCRFHLCVSVSASLHSERIKWNFGQTSKSGFISEINPYIYTFISIYSFNYFTSGISGGLVILEIIFISILYVISK